MVGILLGGIVLAAQLAGRTCGRWRVTKVHSGERPAVQLEETPTGFKASATLLEPSPWPDDEQVLTINIYGTNAEDVVDRLREILDEELGPDPSTS